MTFTPYQVLKASQLAALETVAKAAAEHALLQGNPHGLTPALLPWTAARPSATLRTLEDKAGDLIDARDAGVKQDGADHSAKLQGLINDLAGSGARIVLPFGTTVAAVDIKSGVTLQGCGPLSVLKAPAGANRPVIGTSDFAARAGTNDPSGTAAHDFGLFDLTLDGNRLQQNVTGAARDLASVLQLYAYRYAIGRVHIRDAVGSAFRSSWGQYGEFPMEAHIADLTWDTANRRGVWFEGPHDSILQNIVGVDAGQEADDTYEGVLTGANGVAHWNGFHAWHRSATANRMRASFASAGYSIISNSQFEGGRVLFEAFGGYDQIHNSRFYASFGAAGGCMVDLKAGNTVFGAGNLFENSFTNADVYAIRVGRTATPIVGTILPAHTLFYNFATRGPFDLQGDGGLNRLGGNGFNSATPARANITQRSTMDWLGSSPNAYIRQQAFLPGPFAGDTAAKAAGLVYGEEYLKTGGSTAWVST